MSVWDPTLGLDSMLTWSGIGTAPGLGLWLSLLSTLVRSRAGVAAASLSGRGRGGVSLSANGSLVRISSELTTAVPNCMSNSDFPFHILTTGTPSAASSSCGSLTIATAMGVVSGTREPAIGLFSPVPTLVMELGLDCSEGTRSPSCKPVATSNEGLLLSSKCWCSTDGENFTPFALLPGPHPPTSPPSPTCTPPQLFTSESTHTTSTSLTSPALKSDWSWPWKLASSSALTTPPTTPPTKFSSLHRPKSQ